VNCYRGPAIVQTPSGLVAFAEGRVGFIHNGSFTSSCDDCVQSGIAMRRSTSGGRTWGPVTWALKPESWDLTLPHTTKVSASLKSINVSSIDHCLLNSMHSALV
jgi:hypothetical protein